MNVLIVDDDKFVVAALQKKMPWKELGIDGIYTSYNIYEAMKILEQVWIDIALCDIEMPQGSGLTLLQWIREKNLPVETIILTSYADFNYAQTALKLNSLDYFLKPIDFKLLSSIILKAVEKVKESYKLKTDVENSKFWVKSSKNRKDGFWRNLICGKITDQLEPIENQQSDLLPVKYNIPYKWSDYFLPILIYMWIPEEEKLGADMLSFSLHNIMEETLTSEGLKLESVYERELKEYIILVKIEKDTSKTDDKEDLNNKDRLTQVFKKLMNNINYFLSCDLCIIIGRVGKLKDIYQITKELNEMNGNHILFHNKIFFLDDYVYQDISYTPPELDVFEALLEAGDRESCIKNIKLYMERLIWKEELTRNILKHLRVDITQRVFSYLKLKEIEAYKLYANKESDAFYENSIQSAEDMIEYITNLVATAMDYTKFAGESVSVIEYIIDYIHGHYTEEISRNTLAEIVYLNPDYLAKLFKKKMNTNVGNYVANLRISKAKEYLKTGQLPVHVVAEKIGYGNYSYFSKLFKEIEGCTPNEYRKRFE